MVKEGASAAFARFKEAAGISLAKIFMAVRRCLHRAWTLNNQVSQGHSMDALALRGDEGRGTLR
jgi:hypothetical protein